MSPLFAKLNLTTQPVVHLVNAPVDLAPALADVGGREVRREVRDAGDAAFVLAFATTLVQVSALSVVVAAETSGDAVVWVAYPKASSPRYRCEFNRDTGWSALGAAGFEPVRQVSLDADWSALRFRRVEYIRRFTRSPAMAVSAAGRRRASGSGE